MKHFYNFIVSTTLFVITNSYAQTTITEWNFDTETDVPNIGTGTLTKIGGTTNTYSGGNPSTGKAFNTSTYPAQNTNSGTAGIEIAVSTVGQSNIGITLDHRSSGTASRWAQYEYSTDGTNWIVKGNNNGALSPHDTFTNVVIDLTSCTACNNNANFKFRIVSVFSPQAFNQNSTLIYNANEAYMRSNAEAKFTPEAGIGTGNYAAAGTWRFDNIKVIGGFVLNNNSFTISNTLNMYPNPISNGQKIILDTKETGSIYDINGRDLLNFNNVSEIDINNFNTGVYFIKTTVGKINKFLVN